MDVLFQMNEQFYQPQQQQQPQYEHLLQLVADLEQQLVEQQKTMQQQQQAESTFTFIDEVEGGFQQKLRRQLQLLTQIKNLRGSLQQQPQPQQWQQQEPQYLYQAQPQQQQQQQPHQQQLANTQQQQVKQGNYRC